MYVYVRLLQPRPCARPTSSAVELDAVSGCHGDAMARTTARIAAMKRAVRKLVRLWLLSCFQALKIVQASTVTMTTALNSPLLRNFSVGKHSCISKKGKKFRFFFFFGLFLHCAVERRTAETGLCIVIKITVNRQRGKKARWKLFILFLDTIHQ